MQSKPKISIILRRYGNAGEQNPLDLNTRDFFLLLAQEVIILETGTKEILFYHYNLGFQSVVSTES